MNARKEVLLSSLIITEKNIMKPAMFIIVFMADTTDEVNIHVKLFCVCFVLEQREVR